MATNIIHPEDDWLQTATECAEYTYPLNQERYNEVKLQDLATGRRGTAIYKIRHPLKVKARNIRLRKSSKEGDEELNAYDIELQYKSQKGKCWWCGKKVKDNYHVDHVVPLIKGGTNDPRNIVISCPKCNRKKGAKLPQEFMGRLF